MMDRILGICLIALMVTAIVFMIVYMARYHGVQYLLQ